MFHQSFFNKCLIPKVPLSRYWITSQSTHWGDDGSTLSQQSLHRLAAVGALALRRGPGELGGAEPGATEILHATRHVPELGKAQTNSSFFLGSFLLLQAVGWWSRIWSSFGKETKQSWLSWLEKGQDTISRSRSTAAWYHLRRPAVAPRCKSSKLETLRLQVPHAHGKKTCLATAAYFLPFYEIPSTTPSTSFLQLASMTSSNDP